VQVFTRRIRGVPSAPAGEQARDWLRDSTLRQLFDGDLEEGEHIAHLSRALVSTAKFDRPVTAWVVATDRALRIRWALATAVRQSLHVGYDRMRWVEIGPADPHTAHVTYFDAGHTTAGWYQELRLRADSSELASALPRLVSGHERRSGALPAAPVEVDVEAAVHAPVALPSVHDSAPPVGRRRVGGAHRGRRWRLARH
jgi:hypothetical protein